jgi:hypothetical protein
MPKATWGAGDNPLTADDIDGAERAETRQRYSGPMPQPGTYRWRLGRLKKVTSSNGNDMINVMAFLDGDWKPNHKQYDGAVLFDRVVLTSGNKANVANFLDAIGATGKDLMSGTLIDEAGYITKLGSVGDPEGILVYITVQHSKPTPEYPDKRLETGYAPYIMVEEDDDATGSDDQDDPPPF